MTKALDHGYVKLVTSWGSDESIIEAARMSTNAGFKGWGPIHESPEVCRLHPQYCRCPPKAGDEKLLKYLWTNKHHTPFEMAGLTVEAYAPIFVIREWFRHRSFSYNEMSGRYTILPNDYYIPTPERIQKQAKANKQGSGEQFTDAEAKRLQGQIRATVQGCRTAYELLLDQGVSREIARLVLPVNQYSRFRASGNLRNWLHFLELRLNKAAQLEIRVYADAIATEIQKRFPRTYTLFAESQ